MKLELIFYRPQCLEPGCPIGSISAINLSQKLRYEKKRDVAARTIVVGDGGVGKSRIVSALKSLCKQYGCEDSIAVMAPSGIAAVAIGGSTCDSLCKLNIRGDKISLEASTSWDRILLVVLDEFSMCGQVKLAKIDSHLRKLKSKNSDFSGLGFVLMGDHFQQLPVKDSALWIKPEVPTKFARSKKDVTDVVFINQMNGYRLDFY